MREAEGVDKRQRSSGSPRLCVCVLMNHPYPGNLPLLRRIYAGRFSELLFLIPFERTDDPDVITTYRGSYVHAAYITDALPRLQTIDCDYFLFVHDDVLLNPQFDEAAFGELFPLGEEDGFIPHVQATPPKLGDWEWYFSFLPKLLYPKSLIIGTGIEAANLLRYLPSKEEIRAGFIRSDAPFTERVELDIRHAHDPTSRSGSAERKPSKVMLDGLAASLAYGSPLQQDVDRTAADALRAVTTMFGSAGKRDRGDEGMIELPIPLAASGFYTDCYILPRGRLHAFAHHMGIAGAAGLFVEIIVPVLLHALCARVHTAKSLALDFSGFHRRHPLSDFLDPRRMAIHPFKFSAIRTAEQQDAFVETIAALRAGRMFDPSRASVIGLPPGLVDAATYSGWHAIEPWGRWAAQRHASVALPAPSDPSKRRLRLALTGPVSEAWPRISGTVAIDAGAPEPFLISHPARHAELTLTVEATDEPVLVTLVSNELLRPRDLNPVSPDERQLGVGLRTIEWL